MAALLTVLSSVLANPAARMAHPDSSHIAQRARAAVLGAYVADNAVMGLHWVYDAKDIRKRLIKRQKLLGDESIGPEWLIPPANMYYAYNSGQATPYGMLLMLRYFVFAVHLNK